MIPFILTALFAFIIYLLLTAGSGELVLWSGPELAMGAFLSLVTATISRGFFCANRDYRMANPVRWGTLAAYLIGPFFIEMAKANVDVAYRVITGRIRPGIVRIRPGLKTDLGVLLLANSITLTPGTLTVHVDEETNDFFVHMINIKPGVEQKETADIMDVEAFFSFPRWIRRIAE
ncbi:MAG: Na+/H+ antiporter subunit E [Methanomicrobiaceae archaeon]|uniref:Na(+) h(+) antiporter subunit e n=1 Tax=hydrocarbon metagenome TaxID=938273 RepID=A0A0W8FH86_9ZZZZ|nr:Na+/H+ antiporter subunit E [Methanomicrobiaceae archaeon]MDD5419853.1 Na+/H+ antiporter subunit E [Methanomicrobiaceae archaeon]